MNPASLFRAWAGVALAGFVSMAAPVKAVESNAPPAGLVGTNDFAAVNAAVNATGESATNAPEATARATATNSPAKNSPATNSPVTIDPATGDTKAVNTATNGVAAKSDFTAFRVISERNIFNPNRSARTRRSGGGAPRRTVRVDSFKLAGTMSYDQGDLAFFDGSGATYRKAAKTNETIAGYRITSITVDEVKLEADGKTVTARVGTQFRRTDDGPWVISAAGSPEPPKEAASTDADEPGAEGVTEISGSGSGNPAGKFKLDWVGEGPGLRLAGRIVCCVA